MTKNKVKPTAKEKKHIKIALKRMKELEKNPEKHMGSSFDNFLEEQLKDPEFKAEYDKLQEEEEMPKAKTYSIEDLKTKKIAVHLPTQEEWDRAMVFFEENNVPCSDKSLATSFFRLSPKEDCVDITSDFTGFLHVEQDCCKYYKEQGYTIITLDQLEGLEPTAEEGEPFFEILNNQYKVTFAGKMDTCIIKYQGKEKVITRDDFEETEIKCSVDSPWSPHIKGRISPIKFNKDLGYAEGSRMWAIEMTLEKGFKTYHPLLNAKYMFKHTRGDNSVECLAVRNKATPTNAFFFNMPKDGWEIYKTEPEMMTLREAIKQYNTPYGAERFADKEIKFIFLDNTGVKYIYNGTDCIAPIDEIGERIDLQDVIDWLDREVEIIEE